MLLRLHEIIAWRMQNKKCGSYLTSCKCSQLWSISLLWSTSNNQQYILASSQSVDDYYWNMYSLFLIVPLHFILIVHTSVVSNCIATPLQFNLDIWNHKRIQNKILFIWEAMMSFMADSWVYRCKNANRLNIWF